MLVFGPRAWETLQDFVCMNITKSTDEHVPKYLEIIMIDLRFSFFCYIFAIISRYFDRFVLVLAPRAWETTTPFFMHPNTYPKLVLKY